MSEFIINDERVYYKRFYKEINDKKMEITSAEFVISNTDVKKCPVPVFSRNMPLYTVRMWENRVLSIC